MNFFRQRYAALIVFLQARFSPEGYLGLHLTIGAFVIICAAWMFGGIAEDVVHKDQLTIVDAQVSAWLYEHATPRLTALMLLITDIHSMLGVTLIVVVLALYLWQRSKLYWLLLLVLTVPGGMILNSLVKLAFHRARPVFDNPIVTLTTYSFPSGHTMAATVLYGLLAAFALSTIHEWRWRLLVILTALILILLVGFSRIYLGAHYLSDVLGAMAEGLAWLALCLTAVDTLRRRRRIRQLASSQTKEKL
jgi:undecaprenyl-diphosphatase